MQISIHSFQGMAQRLNSSIRIRYSARRTEIMDTGKNGNYGESWKAAHEGQSAKEKSLVIVRQSYTYLEPFVRSMFDGADDIRIIVDRRFHERRKISIPGLPNRRRPSGDRRFPAPMLDIVIAVES